jgi:macrodomain Ter protein organizer (MatP/YcbG family)
MFPAGAPELPQGLRPVQVAQLSDLLAHIHDRMQSIANAGRSRSEEKGAPIDVDWVVWQRLLKLEMDVATYLRQLTDPATPDS